MYRFILVESKRSRITNVNDGLYRKIDWIQNEENKPKSKPEIPFETPKQPVRKTKRNLQRAVVFNQAKLSSAEDIDRYLAQVKNKLLSYLNDVDELDIQ